MSKSGRFLSGAALIAASAAFVLTAVTADWPLMQLAPSASLSGEDCAVKACDQGTAPRREVSGYFDVAQTALEKMLPSLKDERRLPNSTAVGPAAETAPIETLQPVSRTQPKSAGSAPAADDAENRAKDLARQLARDIANKSSQ